MAYSMNNALYEDKASERVAYSQQKPNFKLREKREGEIYPIRVLALWKDNSFCYWLIKDL